MELRHLRTFVVVAETLNVSAAARRLRVSQPTLSRQIHELEKAVGHPLFVRSASGLRLTTTGAALHQDGGRALATIDAMIEAVRQAAAVKNAPLHVGYYGSVSISAGILAPALDRLGRKFPEVTANVTELPGGQLVTGLREGRLDAAVLGPGEYAAISGVTVEVACTVPAMVMMPLNHRLAKKRQIELDDLRGEEVVSLTEEAAPGRDRSFIAACRAAGFTPAIAKVAASLPDGIVALKKRMAVAIIGAFARQAPHPGVAFIKLKPPGVPLDIFVAHRRSSLPARELAALVVAEARRAALAM